MGHSLPMTRAALAQRVGLSATAVSLKLRNGMTENAIIAEAETRRRLHAQGANNTSDKGFKQAGVRKRNYQRHSFAADPARPDKHIPKDTTRDSQGVELSKYEADLRKAVADAERSELDLRVRSGEMVPIGQVRSWFGGACIKAKDIILAMPDLVERVRQAVDVVEARALLEVECRRALEEIGRYDEFESGDAVEESDAMAGMVGVSAPSAAQLAGMLGMKKRKRVSKKPISSKMGRPKKRGV